MDCKSFARKHSAFVDDTLPGVEMSAMQEHRRTCAACERKDGEIRRALLLVRNLPPIEVSEGFGDRLRARLEQEARIVHAPPPQRWAWGQWAAAASLVTAIAAGVLARDATRDEMPEAVRLPTVVASTADQPGADQPDDQAPFMASMSTALPMWPALMRAEEGSLRFAAIELQQAVWEPSRD